MKIDYESLRGDLINYFGTAMSYNPMAIMDLSRVERCSNGELASIAVQNGFDLGDYEIKELKFY